MSNTSEGSAFGSFGCLLAAFLSYFRWHSFWWAFLHFFAGWIYVLYSIFTYGLPKLPH